MTLVRETYNVQVSDGTQLELDSELTLQGPWRNLRNAYADT